MRGLLWRTAPYMGCAGRASQPTMSRLKYQRTGREVRMFASDFYQAKSWSRARRVTCRVLITDNGEGTRLIVTSFERSGAKDLYETVYCGC